MRIVTGCLMQESNTFSPLVSDRTYFQSATLAYGDESLTIMAGTRTEMRGFLDASAAHGVTLVPTLTGWAPSGGPMADRDFRGLTDQLLERVAAAGAINGVLLALHGAWVSAGEPDADGWLLAEVRRRVGPDVPIVATLDLHANITARMLAAADLLVGYRSYPHTDMYETGIRGAELLFRLIREEIRPVMAARKVPVILPAEKAQTEEGPLAPLARAVRAVEDQSGVLTASLFTVQPWLDVPELGGCIVVAHLRDWEAAQADADRLGTALWDLRHDVRVPLVSPADAVAHALARPNGPVLLVDSADGVSSGAPGDSTAILHALVAARPARPALVTLVDPESARQLASADDQHMTVVIGGHLDPARHRSVTLSGTARRVPQTRVIFTGGIGDGLVAEMGAAAVLTSGPIRVLVTEKPVPCYDPALYRVAGLEPAEAHIVVVKSPSNFRYAYRDIAREWLYVDAPGAATPRLDSLAFTRAPRPLYPLDDDFWQPPHNGPTGI